jgi:hypothetical protein
MKHSESLSQIAPAVAMMQAALKKAPKDAANPFFKSKYADLATCMDTLRPALAVASLSVVQGFQTAEGRVSVETMLLHASGEWISTEISASPKDDAPQSIGSCITYLRRYGLGMTGLVTDEDDDGNQAQGHKAAPASRPSAPAPQNPPKPPQPAQIPPKSTGAAVVAVAPVAPAKTTPGAIIIPGIVTGGKPGKTGVKKDGTPWQVYSVECEDENGTPLKMSTFSKTAYEAAKSAKLDGDTCEFVVVEEVRDGRKYYNLEEVQILTGKPPAPTAPAPTTAAEAFPLPDDPDPEPFGHRDDELPFN